MLVGDLFLVGDSGVITERTEEDLVITLVEAGQSQYLGQVSLTVKLSTILPDTPEHRRASQAVSTTFSPAK